MLLTKNIRRKIFSQKFSILGSTSIFMHNIVNKKFHPNKNSGVKFANFKDWWISAHFYWVLHFYKRDNLTLNFQRHDMTWHDTTWLDMTWHSNAFPLEQIHWALSFMVGWIVANVCNFGSTCLKLKFKTSFLDKVSVQDMYKTTLL